MHSLLGFFSETSVRSNFFLEGHPQRKEETLNRVLIDLN